MSQPQPFIRFEAYSEHLATAVHNFGAHTWKVYLTNTAPDVAAHVVKADLPEISAAGGQAVAGYVPGGYSIGAGLSRTAGVTTLTTVPSVLITASGGDIGPFQWVVLYNDTPTSPADPLAGYVTYTQAVTIPDGETFEVALNDLVALTVG